MWKVFDEGKTLGTIGPDSGIIILDYEDLDIGRITLQNCGNYFAITYAVYGNMIDTIFGKEDALRLTVEGLKIELNAYKYLPYDDELEAVCNWAHELYYRRENSVPEAKDKKENGFNDLRAFSLNHYLLDMFPEIKNDFIEYVGEDEFFYSPYLTYSDILKPYILEELRKENKNVLERFSNLMEDLSYFDDEYISNFYVVGLLEDIYLLDVSVKDSLLSYLKENTIKQYKEYEPQFEVFLNDVDEQIKNKKLIKGKCSKCGGRLAYRHENSTGLVYCIKCGQVEIASTHFNSIVEDDNEYIIKILHNNKINKKKINVIYDLTSLNYIASKKILTDGGEIFKGSAVDAKRFYIKLKVNDIDFEISPDYPLDYLLQKEGW